MGNYTQERSARRLGACARRAAHVSVGRIRVNPPPISQLLTASGVCLAMICSARALERLEPPEGCYLGFSVGGGERIARFNARLGLRPAVYTEFFEFPLTTGARSNLTEFLNQVRPTQGIDLITLEPYLGLSN